MAQQNFDVNLTNYTTKALHIGQDKESWDSLAAVPPITMTANFLINIDKTTQDYVYTRLSNPTRNVMEKTLAALDAGKYGLACASGLGALSVILSSILRTGDHMIYAEDMYGSSNLLIRKFSDQYNFEAMAVDTTDISNLEKAIKANTKLIFLETPTNPLLKVTDLRKLSALAKKYKILVAVDNSFLTSYFQRPLELGVDIIMYSLSKYTSGHSDLIMGALVTNNDELYAKMKQSALLLGGCPSPFNCWLMSRSLKTLSLRMERHMQNGMAVAKFLETHPAIEKVIYTGLPSHSQYELSQSQAHGHNGMIAFYIKGGLEEVKVFVKSFQLISYTGSFGGVKTVIEIPTLLSHEKIAIELKNKLGITDNLVRMSLGIESIDDIIKDLDQALRKATKL